MPYSSTHFSMASPTTASYGYLTESFMYSLLLHLKKTLNPLLSALAFPEYLRVIVYFKFYEVRGHIYPVYDCSPVLVQCLAHKMAP